MYTEMTKMFGMSQSMLETIVLCGIAVAVLGVALVLFWKYILAGVGILFCFVVLANHKSTENPKEEIIVSAVQNAVQVETLPTLPPAPVVTKTEKEMFLEDCLEYTDYSKKRCEFIWNNRGSEEDADEKTAEKPNEKVKLLDVENKEYKRLRALALKKKNAVVFHATL